MPNFSEPPEKFADNGGALTGHPVLGRLIKLADSARGR
jgi:hypothetical protein